MRIVLSIALALIPVWSFAAGYGGAEGRNLLGERIFIASESNYDLYVFKGPNKSDWPKPFDMNTACPEFGKAMAEFSEAMNKRPSPTFSCPSHRLFPLSGTTYRITTSKKYRICDGEFPSIVYICVKGCNSKTAPSIFKESPWECI